MRAIESAQLNSWLPTKIGFILFFSFLSLSIQAQNLVNINQIRVSKDYDASFVLDLYSNDVVTVQYSKNGGKANIEDIVVRVIDLNLQEPRVLDEFKSSGKKFKAPYDGKYRVDFIYVGKGGIRLIRERYLDLKIKIDNDGYFELEDGETREIFHAFKCVIDEGRENALQMTYYLTKGDRITIESADQKSAFLQLYIQQLGKNFSVSNGSIIEITKDNYYTFFFYLKESEGSLLNLRELLENDEILFQDLSIYREKAISFDPSSTATNIGNEYNSGGTGQDENEGESEEDAFQQNFLDIQKMMENSNNSSAETTKMIAEMMMEMQKRQEEMMNKKNVRTEVFATEFDEEFLLEPELNFAVQNGNRQCKELSIFNTNYQFWFYWVGVGDQASKAFEEQNNKITQSFRKSLGNAFAEHLYFKYAPEENSKTKRQPQFPDENDFSNYLSEDIEYAIVDLRNKTAFENGDRYTKKNSSSRVGKFITSDYGLCPKPLNPDETLYFCAHNNNKTTAVNVYFKYFLITVEQETY